MNNTKEVFQGSALFFLGAILAAITTYLTKLLLVRNLSVEQYGLFFAVFSFVLFFTIFRSLGLNQGLARFIAEFTLSKKFSEIKSLLLGSALLQIISSSALVIIIWLLAPWLANNYFGSADAVWILRLMSLYLPLMVLVSNTIAALQGFKLNSWLSFANASLNLCVLLLVSIGLTVGLGIYSAVLGYLGSTMLFFVVFGSVVIKKTKILSYPQKDFFSTNKKLLLFSLPLIITGAGSMFISYFDTLMLTYFDTLVEVGVYNIVYPSAMILALAGSSIGTILLPIVSQMWASKKIREIGNAFEVIYTYTIALLIPPIIILSFFSNEILRVFFGSEYVIGSMAFSILLVAGLFNAIVTINNQALIAIKRPSQTMRIYVVGAVTNLILNLILIPMYSMAGAAVASIISFVAMMVLSVYYIRREIQISLPKRKLIFCGLSAVSIPIVIHQSMSLFTINIYLSAILSSIIAGIVYIVLLALFKVIQIQEIKELYVRK